MQIGMIGLGRMGANMVRRLLRGGHACVVHDVSAAAVQTLVRERLLGDAMAGDAMLFAREDGVEAAWRVVEPILDDPTPVREYARGTWGPTEADRLTTEVGGWRAPVGGAS